MKRSKIFLGATTALLAIAGIAAAKKYSNGTLTAFYVTHDNAYCLSVAGIPATKTGSTLYPLYTTAGGAQIQLFTKGPVGAKSGTVCTVQLRYNNTK